MSSYSHIHHVFTKSISSFNIFRKEKDFRRMIQAIQYYQYDQLPMAYSNFRTTPNVIREGFHASLTRLADGRSWSKHVEILGYCLMNTHIHLIARELEPGAISKYMSNLLNSYTRYFNGLYKRSGPLWQGRFGRYSVAGQESLLKVSVYVHLNPTTAYLVNKPEHWEYSSYRDICGLSDESFCTLMDHLKIDRKSYVEYVEDQIEDFRAK